MDIRHILACALLLCATPWNALAAEPASRPATTLTLLPAKVTLHGLKASQRLLAERKRDATFVGDMTAKTVFTSSNPKVATVGKDGVVRPVSDGTAVITANLQGQKASATITVQGTRQPSVPDFRNHILPILTRAACNTGACHGALAGKGGLKLTLRGYDPDADWDALTRQAGGRRVVKGDPHNSLLLQKPTMRVVHAGGPRMSASSEDYKLVADWIKAGAPRSRVSTPKLARLEVFPPVASLPKGASQQIVVRAHYSNGRVEDVTRWVKFGSSESTVASVDDDGRVKVNSSGEAAITVWFSSQVTFARVVSPRPNAPAAAVYKRAERNNYVDEHILRKLQTLGIPPSPLSSDREFVRRVYLDTLGVLPTPEEVETFVADQAPVKRSKLVDRLLERPEFVDYWTYRWSDLLLVSSRKLSGGAMNSFSQWIRRSVAENKPWNQFAREILTARGSNMENGAANYYVLHKEPIDLTETTTQAFLGMSLTCARCHNHPLEKWTQNQYYEMANLFSRVRMKNGEGGGEVLVLASDKGDINHPRLGVPLPPRPLDGTSLALKDRRDRREALADWLTSPENPYFAKALINRVWRNFMGRGLVEAEDDLRLTNPPSNQELLDALAKDFVRDFDVKRLVRTILNSAAYQRSSEPVPGNEKDDRFYSRYIVKRLPAEVILDALSQVTGVPTEFPNYGRGTRAMQLPDSQVGSYFLTAFGRPERAQTCACERTQEPSIQQALHLSNGETVNMKLRTKGSVIDQLLEANTSDADILNKLYLTALARTPTASEQQKALAILAESVPNADMLPEAKKQFRRSVLEDLFWAVLTDKEFLFNR